ncbi:hypothetical protein EJ08DRAFT_695813 [Tothia fuscella]|uniref:Rhodopsin domain-containing protein n=1 Tax=Tothia fuscella TaxID=1048955 RepID=A0A9P4NVQ0_9PEZI|nr:hypothetical protein EJ08DRAFT_695813 [Tothia fuscella]
MATATDGIRYTVLTPDNQSANIWVTVIISICFTTAAILARGLSKALVHMRYDWDDYTIIGAYVLGIIQSAIMIKSVTLGLGKDASIIPESNVAAQENYLVASVIFSTLTSYTVKVSMILLIQRLFTYPLTSVWIAMGVSGVVSTITITARCTQSSCANPLPRWIVAAVLDILTEIIIIALPIYCIRSIQMDKTRKIKVQMSFCSRILVITFWCLMLWSIIRAPLDPMPKTAVVLPIVFGQTQLCLSIAIAAILPCFRILFQSSEVLRTESTGYPRDEESKNQGSYGMDSVNASSTIAPLPRKHEHSTSSSQDMGGALTNSSETRASESSIAPSANTNQSQRPMIAHQI